MSSFPPFDAKNSKSKQINLINTSKTEKACTIFCTGFLHVIFKHFKTLQAPVNYAQSALDSLDCSNLCTS